MSLNDFALRSRLQEFIETCKNGFLAVPKDSITITKLGTSTVCDKTFLGKSIRLTLLQSQGHRHLWKLKKKMNFWQFLMDYQGVSLIRSGFVVLIHGHVDLACDSFCVFVFGIVEVLVGKGDR